MCESSTNRRTSSEEYRARLGRLRALLDVYPSDIVTRCELAILLEESNQPEEALLNWKAVLDCDPNNLRAREGVARCQRQTNRAM